MTATLSNLRSQIRGGKNNPGFHDGHIHADRRKGQNWGLAKKMLVNYGLPDSEELDVPNLLEGVKCDCFGALEKE